MKKNKYTGEYVKAFLSKDAFIPDPQGNPILSGKYEPNKNETVYIYSFKENKLLFAKGFDKVYGIESHELNAQKLNSLYTPHFKNFIDEYFDRILLYLRNNNQNLNTFSISTIIKVNHFDKPVLLIIRVFDTDENGNLISVIGRSFRGLPIQSTNIVQYFLEGEGNANFMEKINHHLDFKDCISRKDIELIEELTMNSTIEQTSENLNLSPEHIEFYTNNLLSRFKLNSVPELIEFAKNNHLIPNQFKKLDL